MLFNSLDFAVFLPVVFFLFWFVFNRSIGLQNLFLVAASFVFYGWWDWRFLFLMIFSASIDFFAALYIEKINKSRKILLTLSILTNLGILGFFKYFNFFTENFIEAFSFLGYRFDLFTINIVLPVGISFYTFQAMSYTIDVYRGNLKATRDPVAYFAFISFFPQLVAGPIERATNLLPQFASRKVFNYPDAVDGMKQILWGLFKKIVIADNCAVFVNQIFSNYSDYSGGTLLLGGIFFAFQIYSDFSGYSDVAIGTGKLFGFHLMKNFNFPYFSRDIAEFWRRWHISLSTWFRDYVYIPLGGSRGNMINNVRNVFVIFILSGFWHGANWTFVIWGGLNAAYFLPLLILKKNRANIEIVARNRLIPSIRESAQIVTTFLMTVVAWIFFRAINVSSAIEIISRIFSPNLFNFPEVFSLQIIILLFFFLILEWYGRSSAYTIADLGLNWPRGSRWSFYVVLIGMIIVYGGQKQDFIYFQF